MGWLGLDQAWGHGMGCEKGKGKRREEGRPMEIEWDGLEVGVH